MVIGIGIFFIPGNQKQKVLMIAGVGTIALSVAFYLMISKSQFIVDDFGLTKKTVFKTKEVSCEAFQKLISDMITTENLEACIDALRIQTGKIKIKNRSAFNKKSSCYCLSCYHKM